MIEYECDECSYPIRVEDNLVGRKARCPGCGAISTIPDKQSAAQAAKARPSAAASTGAKPPPHLSAEERELLEYFRTMSSATQGRLLGTAAAWAEGTPQPAPAQPAPTGPVVIAHPPVTPPRADEGSTTVWTKQKRKREDRT